MADPHALKSSLNLAGWQPPVDPAIDSLDDWWRALSQPSALAELAALLVCGLMAWLVVRLLSRGLERQHREASILLGRHQVDGVLFPLLLLTFAYAAKFILQMQAVPMAVFRVAIPVLLALVMMRLGVKVLQATFKNAPWVRVLERSISWGAWGALVLWVSGLLPIILDELGEVTWKVGGTTLSVRTLLEGVLTAGTVLLLALWISSVVEARLLRSATGNELSVRKAVSNVLRVLLVFVGLLVGLSSVGIDLTALSVLGGAIGVGVGLGLQKLAASYVSGFVILTERSVRIGDNVRVDTFEGRITDIRARYTVVRAPSGRESIVPNEMFISSRVENLSLITLRAQQTTTVSVSYDSDVELVMRLMLQAAQAQPRVLREPAPTVNLSTLGVNGLDFTLSYWMSGAESGEQTLHSHVNVGILRALRENRIEIAVPQRVIQTRGSPAVESV